MSCCMSREDPIGCCGTGCPHEDAEREAKEAKACTCIYHEPDDQCPVHGFEVWKREQARADADTASTEELEAASDILDRVTND